MAELLNTQSVEKWIPPVEVLSKNKSSKMVTSSTKQRNSQTVSPPRERLQPSSSITLENNPTKGQVENHLQQPENPQQKKDKKMKRRQKSPPPPLWKNCSWIEFDGIELIDVAKITKRQRQRHWTSRWFQTPDVELPKQTRKQTDPA
jgi:hypothetical protein